MFNFKNAVIYAACLLYGEVLACLTCEYRYTVTSFTLVAFCLYKKASCVHSVHSIHRTSRQYKDERNQSPPPFSFTAFHSCMFHSCMSLVHGEVVFLLLQFCKFTPSVLMCSCAL